MPLQNVFCRSKLTPVLSTSTTPNLSFHAAFAVESVFSKSKSGISRSAFRHALSEEMKLIPTRINNVVPFLPAWNLVKPPAARGGDPFPFTPSGTTRNVFGVVPARLFIQTPLSRKRGPLKSMQKKDV